MAGICIDPTRDLVFQTRGGRWASRLKGSPEPLQHYPIPWPELSYSSHHQPALLEGKAPGYKTGLSLNHLSYSVFHCPSWKKKQKKKIMFNKHRRKRKQPARGQCCNIPSCRIFNSGQDSSVCFASDLPGDLKPPAKHLGALVYLSMKYLPIPQGCETKCPQCCELPCLHNLFPSI